MNKNSSTSNFELSSFLKKTTAFIAIVLAISFVLLLIVFFGPKEPVAAREHAPTQLTFFGASNVGFDFDAKRLGDAQLVSYGEPYGLFIAFDLLKQDCAGKTVVADMPYSWYAPAKYAPASYFFYQQITPSLYAELFKKDAGSCTRNFLSTNLFNSEVWLFLRSAIFKDRFGKPVAPGHNENLEKDGYYTCKNKFDRNKHNITETTYSQSHIDFIKSELSKLEQDYHVKVLVKYPELNKDNYKISPKLVNGIKDNFDVVNQFEAWPDSLMFDQWYHMNACGMEQNTNNVQAVLANRNYLVIK